MVNVRWERIAVVSLALVGATLASDWCSYEDRYHDILDTDVRSIGLTLCRTHFAEGSDEYNAVVFALDHYNDVTRCEVRLYVAGFAAHTDYADTLKNDGRFRIDRGLAQADSSGDSSYSGRTVTRTNSSGRIDEFDIHFNKDVSWDYGSPTSWDLSTSTTSFKSVLLHELGHGVGFSHAAGIESDLSIMGSKCGKWIQNMRVGLKAYDYGHLRHHYPDSVETSKADLILSNYCTSWNGSTYECELNDGLSDTTVTAGSSLTLTWTRMNIGDRDVANDYYAKVYLSTDDEITTSDTCIKTWLHTGSVTKHSTLYSSTTITIPSSTAAGTYYVGIRIDTGSDVAEHIDSNNDLVIWEQVTVTR